MYSTLTHDFIMCRINKKMFVSYFEMFAYRFTYFLLLLLSLWISLIVFCPEGEIHFNGIKKEDDETFVDKLFNRFYFSIVTGTTLGYGDISPKSKTARIIIIAFLLLMFFGFFNIFHEMHLFNSTKA